MIFTRGILKKNFITIFFKFPQRNNRLFDYILKQKSMRSGNLCTKSTILENLEQSYLKTLFHSLRKIVLNISISGESNSATNNFSNYQSV